MKKLYFRVKVFVLFTVCFFYMSILAAQKYVPVSNNKYSLTKLTGSVGLDGSLQDVVWSTIPALDSFYNKWPTDQGKAVYQTRVQMAYDDVNLYIAFKAMVKNKPVIQSLKRDASTFWIGDGVLFSIDALNQRSQALVFGLNAGGTQFDGIMQADVGLSWDWDGKWISAVKQYADFYTGEIAIPLQTLRYRKEQKQWGFGTVRADMSVNCYSTWSNIPVNFSGIDMGYMGTLAFEDELAKTKSNRVIVPYVTGALNKDYLDNSLATFKPNMGGDVKLAVNSSLNLDLTVNPDFSQVDVDRQVINTERFNLFFPERRNFFLENSDLFASYGRDGIRPFFSRRIGLGEGGRQLPIIAGARLTGNISKDTRIGFLNVQTNSFEQTPSANYTVAAFEKRILKRSNIKALFTNRQKTESEAKANDNISDYNRVGGGEFNYISSNSRYTGSIKYFRSFNAGLSKEADYMSAGGIYATKHWWIRSHVNRVNKNFIADAGFTPRLYNYDAGNDTTIRVGFTEWTSFIQYRIFPQKNKKVNVINLEVAPSAFWNTDGSLNEATIRFAYGRIYANRRTLSISYQPHVINLLFQTQLFKETGKLMPGKYSYHALRVDYGNDVRKPFSWNLSVDAGSFYNGSKYTASGTLNYRVQPWGNFGVTFSQSYIELNNIKTDVTLISPIIEFNFSPVMYWTTFLQYNTQIQNFNINSRFQWRFKPMSDLFLVYTDNYDTNGLMIKNRSLVLKLNYWLNW